MRGGGEEGEGAGEREGGRRGKVTMTANIEPTKTNTATSAAGPSRPHVREDKQRVPRGGLAPYGHTGFAYMCVCGWKGGGGGVVAIVPFSA